MHRALLVGVGGFIGSVARYWLAGTVQRLDGTLFPLGTLAVNTLGSFLIGFVLVLSLERGLIDPNWRLFLAVGVLGGFTTMSTFSFETLALVRDASLGAACLNIGTTLTGCLAAVWLGESAARLL